MRLANLRKKAILGVPLPIIAMLAVTISAGLALFVLEQRFVGSVDITETSAIIAVFEADGVTPLTAISFGVDLPADVIGLVEGYTETYVFVIQNDNGVDLATWAYVEGLNPAWFDFTISAMRDDATPFGDITDLMVRAQGPTLGLTLATPTATCTLTITSVSNDWLGETSIPLELVVVGEQVSDWGSWS